MIAAEVFLWGTKIHMQSLGAIAHYDFNNPGAYSYEQAANIIYQLGMGQKEIEQLYRRMVFNVMARNQDDHVKNISFLMDKQGKWSLSPAYDITYSYDKTNRWLAKHQMSINGKVDDFTIDDLRECAKRMNISKHKMEKIVEDVAVTTLQWEHYAQDALIREQTYEEIRNNMVKFQE